MSSFSSEDIANLAKVSADIEATDGKICQAG